MFLQGFELSLVLLAFTAVHNFLNHLAAMSSSSCMWENNIRQLHARKSGRYSLNQGF